MLRENRQYRFGKDSALFSKEFCLLSVEEIGALPEAALTVLFQSRVGLTEACSFSRLGLLFNE